MDRGDDNASTLAGIDQGVRAALCGVWTEVKRDNLSMPDEHVATEVSRRTGIPPEIVLIATGHKVHD